jgi:nucleoside 2-deoxyribosyltransferase
MVGKILTEISESKFVVAEFTGHRNGVYFEAGYARGLGIPVIWVCRQDVMKDAHFDTNHFNHLTWSAESPLMGRLVSRIVATIGPGPHKQK